MNDAPILPETLETTLVVQARSGNAVHGHAKRGNKTAEYRIWVDAKNRIRNPNYPHFKDYGGRGITMAPAFLHSFPAFLAEVGLRPSSKHTLDRIDTNKGYEPGNLRWATRAVQSRNQRRAKLTMADAQRIRELRGKRSNKEIAAIYGISGVMVSRIQRGKAWIPSLDDIDVGILRASINGLGRALRLHGVSDDQATLIANAVVIAIAKGAVPNVRIEY